MNWWDILKSAKGSSKVSSKGKGTSFDASKVKINIKDDESCVEKFNNIIDYIKEESKKIINSSKLEHDLPASEDMADIWVWFGETQEDIEESSSDNSVHKTLMQYEHNLHNATNEEDACDSLKVLSNKQINRSEVSYFDNKMHSTTIRHHEHSPPHRAGGQIISEVFEVIFGYNKHYQSVYKRKPEIKQHISDTIKLFHIMQKNIIQMAKDAVREKGL